MRSCTVGIWILVMSLLISCRAEQSETHSSNGLSRIIERSSINASAGSDWPEARFATAGTIEPAQQRAGDPLLGRRALLEQSYVSCGLPERIFRQLLGKNPVVGIEGRTADANGLPYSVNVFENADGIKVVANNCLSCHASTLFGELVIGLGNEFLDFTGDASASVEQAGALVRSDAELKAWELFANRIAAIAPFIRTETVGVNPANNLTFALIAHRDASTQAWSDDPLLPLPPTQVPPVSVPPWWRMAKKTAMFNLGEGRKDHARIMMAASMLCSDTLEELRTVDEYASDIRAFIGSLSAPDYPFSIDAAKANEGESLFVQNCAQCHGTYPDDAEHTYPSKLVALDVVQTDPTLVEIAHGKGVPYIDWFNRSYYGKLSTAAPGPGYVAPPLDGIWATAPYLHNGSVPTIAAVLESSSRPEIWRHTVKNTNDPASYDQKNLGWSFEKLSSESLNPDDKTIYNTQRPGYSNSGHPFGDHLSDTQRSAVIAYLKTL